MKMTVLFDELADQPRALREMLRCYDETPALFDFTNSHPARELMFTGMGASFHAASIGALTLRAYGVKSFALETVELFQYASSAGASDQWTVYISQSGSSGEVGPFLDWFPRDGNLAVITNHQESELGGCAGQILPLHAGLETLIAAKTYVNSLGILWLLARRVSGNWDGSEFAILGQIAGRADEIFSQAGDIRDRFNAFYDPGQPLLFLGHGPHAVTARQAAMGMSEWAKIPALHAGIGAYRHGFIESIRPGHRVVVFSPPGRTRASALVIADELRRYGAQVLLIENGRLREPGEKAWAQGIDELLSPLLDILPVQIAADALAQELRIEPGFRYISKVVRQM
jgi:glucosamine--fructose-6-phosphate aminotransferase (isomerizing)